MECSHIANQLYNKVFSRTFLYPTNERLVGNFKVEEKKIRKYGKELNYKLLNTFSAYMNTNIYRAEPLYEEMQ